MIATECPTCHTGLEMHQMRAEKVLGKKTNGEDPVLHAASGHGAGPVGQRKVGVHENMSESREFLRAKGLA